METQHNKMVYSFNKDDNGGEQFMFSSEIYEGCFNYMHKFELQSFGNSATFTLIGEIITPTKLRELADALETFQNS